MRGYGINHNPNYKHTRMTNDYKHMKPKEIPQITDEPMTRWRYRRIPDAIYYFLCQVGNVVHYRAVCSPMDKEPFIIDVETWLENYERITER